MLPPRNQLPLPVIREEPPFRPNSRPGGRFSFLYSTRRLGEEEDDWDGWPRLWPRALAAALVLNVVLVAAWWFLFDKGAAAPTGAAPAAAAAQAPASVPSSVLFFQPITIPPSRTP